MNEIRRLGTNRNDAYWVNFVTSLTGKYVGSLPYERMDAEVLEDTPTVSILYPRMLGKYLETDLMRYVDDP